MYKCDVEILPQQKNTIKTTQLLFEVLHYLEEGLMEAIFFTCWETKDDVVGNGALPAILRLVHAQKTFTGGSTTL